MTNHFSLPIHIDIKPSPWLTLVVTVNHIGAAFALYGSDLDWPFRVSVTLLIAASFSHVLQINVLQKHPAAPVHLFLHQETGWWLTTRNGHILPVHLMPGAFVHPLVTVLSFRCGKQRFTVYLTPDVVDMDAFRRLRVWLRLQRITGTAVI